MAQTGLLNSIWQIVLQIIPFLLLLLLHHFLLAPLFFRKKLIAYIPVTVVLLTAFGPIWAGSPDSSRARRQ